MLAHVRSKDLSCNNQQGYPPLFGVLSQQWTRQILLEGNDFAKPRHNTQQDLMAHQKVWPHVPFHLREKHRTAKPSEATISALWDQLAKVDYFSPMLWKVDIYGNVLYRYADAGSLLSWKLDYHFPIERGGLSKPANMRIIQYDAHVNKADKLEFVLSREMVCTGLSLFDFRQAVAQHTMESLLDIYARQQHAVLLQLMPATAAHIDRQHSHRSQMSLPRMSVSSQNEVLPGMKAHRAAHAAAAHSDRLSSGSRRHSASFSVPSQPAVRDAPPTRIASSPRFSLHSDRVADPDPYYHVVEAMSQASMPQHHRDSLHRRSSQSSRYSSATAPLYYPEADSQPAATHAGSHYHVTEPMLQPMLPPRHSSSMQRLSRHSSRFSDSNSNPQVPASSAMPQQPASGRPFTSSHRQSSQSSRSAQQPQVSSAQSISHHAPPWGISQDQSQAKLAALSDLYQSSSPPRNQAPSPPQRPKSLSSHLPQQRQSKQPQPQQRQQQQRQQQQVLTTVPASQPLLPAVSAAYMSGFQNGFQTGFQHGSLPVLQQYSAASGRSSFALEAPNLFLEDSSSGELDGYTMMDTTFEQAQAWQSSLLEVTEVPPSEQGDEARSVASFEPEPAVHAAPAVAQRAEGAAFQTSQAAASPRAQHAVHAFEHAVVPELSSAGMVPPEHQSGTSPHDWLKLPDEAQEEEHQQAPSTPDSPYAIDNWLSSQQADCLASGRQLSGEWTGFENRHAVHAAASSTPSITPASSFENTSGQFLQAHRQQQPEEASVAVNSKQVPLPSDILYDRLQQLNQLPVSSQASQPHATATASEAQQPSEPQQSLTPQERSQQQQGVAQQPASASPFAHWSSTPILGPSNQSGRVTSTAGPAGMFQQAQQVFELRRQPQHAQRPPSLDWPAQHAQQAEQAQRSTTAAADPQVRRITSPSTTPTQSDSPSVVQQGFDIPFTNTSSPRQTAAATQHVQTRPSESWQASSLQEPGDTSHVDSSLLLTFAPVGSGDLSVPNRQSPAHGLSPSSSRELADSPDSTSLQASEWAAFAPHRIQQVAVPTRRTLDFDVQADSELQPEAQHESEPDLESHQPESCSHMPNSYSHMSTQPEYQPQFESQHAQQSNLQAQQEHKHVPFADVPEKPEAAFQSQPQATAGPTTNGFSATTDATNATATPQNTSHSFAMELSTPTVGDRGHPGLSMVPVGPFAAAAEPETPSARDIAHKGPALPFAPEWSHSTAGSCTGKVADTAASWSEADQPVDVTQPKSYLEGPAADPQAADDSLQHAANQIAAPGSSFAVTPSRHDADETDVGVVADSSPEAGTEAAAGTDADADMSLQADTSHEADAEADAATEARPDPEAGLSRTGSSAVTAAAAPAAGKSSLDGLSALASLLASAVGKLSSSPADPTPSSETPRDSPADFGPDNDSPRTLSADTLLRSDSHREAFAIPTPGIESPRDSSPDPNPRSDTPKDAGNTSMLNAHSSAEQLDPQQTVPASTHQPAGAVIAQQLSATAHNTGNSNSWTHEPPSAAWGTPKFDGQGAAAPAASGSTAAVAAAKAPIPPSQATGIVNAELAAPSGHAFSQPEQLAAATTAVTAASASKAQGSSNPPLATPSTPQTPEHPPALPAALSLLTTPLTAQNSTRTSNLSQAQHGRSVAPAPTQITATALLSSKSLPPLTIADAVLPSMPSTAQRPSVAPAAVQNGAAPALSPSRARSAGTGVAKGSSSSSGSKHAPLLAAQSSQARAEAMHTLAERVRGMAAQLDALKKIELPTAAASSSPRRLGRSATFNPQRHSSPATAATAQDRALPGRPAQPTSPSTAATAQARAELNGPSVESVPVATTAKEGRADLSSLRGQSGADSAQATAVQGSPLMGSSPQVADAVQRINRATSDLSHSSRRHE